MISIENISVPHNNNNGLRKTKQNKKQKESGLLATVALNDAHQTDTKDEKWL